MNSLTLAVLLQLVGVAVIIAEIIIPSGGIISIIAIIVFGYSLFIVFHDISTATGILFVVADLIMIPVLVLVGLKLLAKSPATLKTELSRAGGVTSQAPDLESYIDKHGIAVTDLHPAGTAMIEGKRVDVVSRGEYIEKGSILVVLAATGNRIVVKQTEAEKQ